MYHRKVSSSMTPSAVSWSLPPGPTQPVTNTPSRIPLHAEMLGTPQHSPYITATLNHPTPLGATSSGTRLPQHCLNRTDPPPPPCLTPQRTASSTAVIKSDQEKEMNSEITGGQSAQLYSGHQGLGASFLNRFPVHPKKNNRGELGLRDPSCRWCEDPAAGGLPVVRGCL